MVIYKNGSRGFQNSRQVKGEKCVKHLGDLAVLTLGLGLFATIIAPNAHADGITAVGAVTQSESDTGNIFVNNPSLNNVADGDAYTVGLNFAGSIASTGTFDLTGDSLVFSDPTAPASESSFTSISLTVTAGGASDDLSLFACLSTGDGCLDGNCLSLNFGIPSADLNSLSARAATILGLSPALDLEENDEVPDIQGNVATYSYPSTVGTVPEPRVSCALGFRTNRAGSGAAQPAAQQYFAVEQYR
jgi:hypothetical protein